MSQVRKEFKEGVPNKRKAMIKPAVEYPIYGLFYKDNPGTNAIAAVAAKSAKAAINMLEKAFSKAEMHFLRVPLEVVAEDTGYKTSKKGIIYAYDSISRKVLSN